MRPFVVISLITFLTGCYSQQGLESREPLSVLEVAADPETLAQCIPRQFSVLINKQIAVTEDDTNIIVTRSGSTGMIVYMWEVRLSPTTSGHSRAIIRSHNSIYGPFFDQEGFDAVAACGEIISREDAG